MEIDYELIRKGSLDDEFFASENAAVARARELFPDCAIEPFRTYGQRGAFARPVYSSPDCVGDEEKRVAYIVATRL